MRLRRSRLDTRPEALGLFALVLASALYLYGCGGEALRTHARAVVMASTAVTAAEAPLREARSAELDACHDTACLDAGEARWAPAIASFNLAVTALEGWVSTLEVVRLAEQDDAQTLTLLLRAAEAALVAYQGLADALEPVGVTLPDLAPVLAMLGLTPRARG